jgi:signal transduction histidine kinase
MVVKEALNNTVKHYRATELWLRARVAGTQVLLTVEDNGCGFDPEAPETRGGNGLGNMASRVRTLGGAFQLSSKVGRGTRIE